MLFAPKILIAFFKKRFYQILFSHSHKTSLTYKYLSSYFSRIGNSHVSNQECSTPKARRALNPPPQIFKRKNISKRSVISAFPCVVLLVWNLVLRHFEVLNFYFSFAGHYIQSKFPKYWYNFATSFVNSASLLGKIMLRPRAISNKP